MTPLRLLLLVLACAAIAGCSGVAASPTPRPANTATPGGMASGSCPTAQPSALPPGKSRTVNIETARGAITIKVEANLSPIAAGNFVALASCGFYDGVMFHRVVRGFVIQGGDPTGTGTGGPGYTIQDEPVKATYSRGTVAMARTPQPNSVGSQFFIVLDDAARQSLAAPQYNNYQIVGTVSAGMDAVDAIAAAVETENPSNPVAMSKVTVSNP